MEATLEQNNKEYTGSWIPAQVMEDSQLKPIDKLVYAEIASFIECFASNEFLANRVGVSVRVLQTCLKRLKDAGYIYQSSFDGRRRVLQTRQNIQGRHEESNTSAMKNPTPIDNSIDNSIDINTKEIVVSKKEVIVNPEIESLFQHWESVYGYYPKQPASERREAKKLLKTHGYDRTAGAVKAAHAAKDMEYSPVITTFKHLWYKWENLEAFYRRKAGQQQSHSVTITE